MTPYRIDFWRGDKRVVGYEGAEFGTPEEAHEHVTGLLREKTRDPWGEDWTGCRFQVISSKGERMHVIPVLAAMSALARKAAH